MQSRRAASKKVRLEAAPEDIDDEDMTCCDRPFEKQAAATGQAR